MQSVESDFIFYVEIQRRVPDLGRKMFLLRMESWQRFQ